MSFPPAAVSVDGSTFRRRAAASVSISRAAAPIVRIMPAKVMTLSLLPVNIQ